MPNQVPISPHVCVLELLDVGTMADFYLIIATVYGSFASY